MRQADGAARWAPRGSLCGCRSTRRRGPRPGGGRSPPRTAHVARTGAQACRPSPAPALAGRRAGAARLQGVRGRGPRCGSGSPGQSAAPTTTPGGRCGGCRHAGRPTAKGRSVRRSRLQYVGGQQPLDLLPHGATGRAWQGRDAWPSSPCRSTPTPANRRSACRSRVHRAESERATTSSHWSGGGRTEAHRAAIWAGRHGLGSSAGVRTMRGPRRARSCRGGRSRRANLDVVDRRPAARAIGQCHVHTPSVTRRSAGSAEGLLVVLVDGVGLIAAAVVDRLCAQVGVCRRELDRDGPGLDRLGRSGVQQRVDRTGASRVL